MQRRAVLSQNFLYSRKLVNKLVRQSSLCSQDTVVEIGTGKGIITEQLLAVSKNVIGIEIDTELYYFLKNKFWNYRNRLQLVNKDILQWHLPKYPYKVFANIPFSIEGKIIRKLLNAPIPPDDCYLIMREDLALRLSGQRRESQFSIFYKPWFTFEIIRRFQKIDYEPVARMDTVMLRFTKRKQPGLTDKDKKRYMMFVGQGFGGGKRLEYNLRAFLSHEQFRKAAQVCKIGMKVKPSDLKIEQWIRLFQYVRGLGKI